MITLTGVLQPCDGCLEAKGIRAGTRWRMTSRAERPMESAYTYLSGPYEAYLGESVYLIMFVDNASRCMRPYGMRRKSETTAYVQKFLADMNGMVRPNCFRTDETAGSSSAATTWTTATLPRFAASTRPRGSRSRTRLSKVLFGMH